MRAIRLEVPDSYHTIVYRTPDVVIFMIAVQISGATNLIAIQAINTAASGTF
jgi:hypothetical protein